MTARHSRGPRLFLSDARFVFSPNTPQHITLNPEQSHYVRDVLRLGEGDPLEIGESAAGRVAAATVTNISDLVTVTLHSLVEARQQQREIALLCALCKGDKNEQILDWATELGCSAIHFWQASRSIVRLRNEQERTRKADRFVKIAVAAAQQSRQTRPPTVAIHQTLSEALNAVEHLHDARKILCSLTPGIISLKSFLSSQNSTAPCVIALGPEGDFTAEEEEFLIKTQSFTPVSLGVSTLRSELAAVAALISIRIHDEPT